MDSFLQRSVRTRILPQTLHFLVSQVLHSWIVYTSYRIVLEGLLCTYKGVQPLLAWERDEMHVRPWIMLIQHNQETFRNWPSCSVVGLGMRLPYFSLPFPDCFDSTAVKPTHQTLGDREALLGLVEQYSKSLQRYSVLSTKVMNPKSLYLYMQCKLIIEVAQEVVYS